MPVACATLGTLNAVGDNAVLVPHAYPAGPGISTPPACTPA